jgi:hypothetical protein
MKDLVLLEKIARREELRALVLHTVSCPTKRVLNMALNEFMVPEVTPAWLYQGLP